MPYDINAQLEEYRKQNPMEGGSSGFFDIAEGANKLRILSEMEVITQHYVGKKGITCYGQEKGCPFHEQDSPPARPKWFVYVFDYKTNEVKIARFAYTIVQQLADLQKNEEYHFDGVPMPYDITLVAKNAGQKEVEYSIVPARQNTPIAEEILKEFEKTTPLSTIVERMKNKQMRADGNEGKKEGNPIPSPLSPASVEYPENNLGEQPF